MAAYKSWQVVSQVFAVLSLFTKSHAVLNVEDLSKLNYEIYIESDPVLDKHEEESRKLRLSSVHGQMYQCLLPEVPLPSTEQFQNPISSHPSATEEITQLLSPLCLVRTKDWWTYEVCIGSVIKQYHLEDGKTKGDTIILGYFESDYNWEKDERGKNRDERYHSQFYTNGTKCDLNGHLRSAEVRYKCEEDRNDYIYHVEEPESCHYIITIHTSRICSHPLLYPLPTSQPHKINCNPLLEAEHFNSYQVKRRYSEQKNIAEGKEESAEGVQVDITLLNFASFLKGGDEENEKQDEDEDNARFRKLSEEARTILKKDKLLEEDKQRLLNIRAALSDKIDVTKIKKRLLDVFENENEDFEELTSTMDKLMKKPQNLYSEKEDIHKVLGLKDDTEVDEDVNNHKLEKETDVSNKESWKIPIAQAIKNKLEQAGLNKGGRRLEVKIITSEDDDPSSAFSQNNESLQDMIVQLLSNNKEQLTELTRLRELEENYHFRWNSKEEEEE